MDFRPESAYLTRSAGDRQDAGLRHKHLLAHDHHYEMGCRRVGNMYWPTLPLVFIAGAGTFIAIRAFKNTEQQTKDAKAFD